MVDEPSPDRGGAPRDAYADPDFVIVRMTAVRALGSWEAAGCFQRIAWRCERDGEWTATMQQIADEIGVSVRTAQRITNTLRDLGWIESERAESYRATLTWRVVWADCQIGSDENTTSHTDNLAGSESASPAASQTAKVAASSSQTSKTGKTPSSRGTRLPEDWMPDEGLREWFTTHPIYTFVNPGLETEKFRNYWHAKTGSGATKIDWRKTWMNWMLSAAQRNGYTGQTHEELAPHGASVVEMFK